jgi:hypothetical protein
MCVSDSLFLRMSQSSPRHYVTSRFKVEPRLAEIDARGSVTVGQQRKGYYNIQRTLEIDNRLRDFDGTRTAYRTEGGGEMAEQRNYASQTLQQSQTNYTERATAACRRS